MGCSHTRLPDIDDVSVQSAGANHHPGHIQSRALHEIRADQPVFQPLGQNIDEQKVMRLMRNFERWIQCIAARRMPVDMFRSPIAIQLPPRLDHGPYRHRRLSDFVKSTDQTRDKGYSLSLMWANHQLQK